VAGGHINPSFLRCSLDTWRPPAVNSLTVPLRISGTADLYFSATRGTNMDYLLRRWTRTINMTDGRTKVQNSGASASVSGITLKKPTNTGRPTPASGNTPNSSDTSDSGLPSPVSGDTLNKAVAAYQSVV
jgi:hypothetical protein